MRFVMRLLFFLELNVLNAVRSTQCITIIIHIPKSQFMQKLSSTLIAFEKINITRNGYSEGTHIYGINNTVINNGIKRFFSIHYKHRQFMMSNENTNI